jgi:hypothetical protein
MTVSGARMTVSGLSMTVSGARMTVSGVKMTVSGVKMAVSGAKMTVSIQSSVERLRNRFRFSADGFFCSSKCPERHCGQPSLLLIEWKASFSGDGEIGTC